MEYSLIKYIEDDDLDIFRLNVPKDLQELEKIFIYACEHELINILKFTYDIMKDEASLVWGFCMASKNGKLNAVKILLEISENNIDIFFDSDMEPLIYASENGHLSIIKYFYGLNIDIFARGNEVFKNACQLKYLDIIEFFGDLKEFNDKIDIVIINEEFWNACTDNNLEVVKLLYNITGENVFPEDDDFEHEDLFSEICALEHICIAKWIYSNFEIHKNILEKEYLCSSDNSELHIWLKSLLEK